MSYVVYSDEAGVYLGSALGLGFWSKWDCAGQDSAVVFNTIEEIENWKTNCSGAQPGFRPVEVKADDGNYASMDACVAAGLPRWDPFSPATHT
jgi:hypothetical protein